MLKLVRRLFFVTFIFTTSAFGAANAATSQGHGAGELKVMTWNVAGGRCGTDQPMSPFAQEIREHGPDVVALQEVHRNQAQRVGEATGMHVFFVGTLDCREKVPDFGMAILSRRPFVNDSGKAYPFGPVNHPDDSERREFRKMAGVSIRVGRQLVRIYNTHLTGIGDSDSFFNLYRVLQVERVLSYIAEDQRASRETFRPILMGDFNSQRRTVAYSLLLARFRDADPQKATTRAGTRVDYIFVGRGSGLRVEEAGVLSTGRLSDHFPVIARLFFN